MSIVEYALNVKTVAVLQFVNMENNGLDVRTAQELQFVNIVKFVLNVRSV